MAFSQAEPGNAQSTISENPLELTASGGLWAPLMPAYKLGTAAGGGNAIRDDQDNVGGIVRLKAIRRFLGTRTSFELKGFFADADSSSNSGVTAMNVPNPTSGANVPLAGGAPSLKSQIQHYGGDIGLRDTWRTRFGGLSAGAFFSYMAFDQDFDVNYSATDLFRENLKSDFQGGKLLFGWDGSWRCHPTNLDLGVGFYDMNADYNVIGQSIPGQFATGLNKTVTTIETSLTTRSQIRNVQVGLTFGVMYISDMPQINHNAGSAASLGTDDAVTLSGMIDILLL